MSLIELMIAITLGVMLTLGMVEVFGTTRAAYQTASSLSRLQEGGRFAMEFVRGDLRMGAQWGCFNEYTERRRFYNHLTSAVTDASPPQPDETGAPWPFRTDLPIEGFEYTDTAPGDTVSLPSTTPIAEAIADWTPALPAELADVIGFAVASSDIIVVRYAEAESVPLVGVDMASGGAMAVAQADIDFIEAGRVYALTDCEKMSLVQVSVAPTVIDGLVAGDGFFEAVFFATPGAGLNQVMPEHVAGEEDYPGAEYGSGMPEGEGAPIHRYRMVVYYVGLESGETVPSLYRRELVLTPAGDFGLGPGQRLIDGVESLQITYGASISISQAGNRLSGLQGVGPTSYVTAATLTGGEDDNTTAAYVEGFRRAKKIRASLLLRGTTPAAVEGGGVAYNVGDVMFNTPTGDTNLRSVYDTTVAVRNRY